MPDSPMFSVVVPVRNRIQPLYRALRSLKNQTFGDYEVIVVDDASTPSLSFVLRWIGDDRFRFVYLREHSERAIARTKGMEEARGGWICWLDSDDRYEIHYLSTLNKAIKANPGAKCFNFGAVVHWRNVTKLRPTFKPKWLGDRHVEFKSGKIGTGSFAFHRSVLDEIEPLPQVSSPYKLHELATDIHHLYPYPGPTLGNPWGDDWLFFYRITRKFRSFPLNNCLYVQFVRGHHD